MTKKINPVQREINRLRARIPKPFERYGDWLRRQARANGSYRCPECGGSGQVVAPDEVPDPCEGYKMARRIKCGGCNGTGSVTLKQIQQEYRRLKDDHDQQRRSVKQHTEDLITIFKRLPRADAEKLLAWRSLY
jgi:hypothetical protein